MTKSQLNTLNRKTALLRASVPFAVVQILLIVACLSPLLTLAGCTENGLSYNEQLFTIPFSRNVEQTVWNYSETFVELQMNRQYELRAPNDTFVVDAWASAITLKHAQKEAIVVLDGIDTVSVEKGDKLCGGEVIGKTRQLRISSYWGVKEDDIFADLSLVRVIRNSTVTNLADVRFADQLHSALYVEGGNSSHTNINAQQCVFGGRK